MKFIIINEDIGFTRTECAHWVIAHKGHAHGNLITREVASNGRDQYCFNLPNTPSHFSISGDTLFWGKQWIGSVSLRINPEKDVHEYLIYFNQEHARNAFNAFITMSAIAPKSSIEPPVFAIGACNGSEGAKNRKSSKPLGSAKSRKTRTSLARLPRASQKGSSVLSLNQEPNESTKTSLGKRFRLFQTTPEKGSLGTGSMEVVSLGK